MTDALTIAVEALHWLDRRGGLGLDIRTRIRESLAAIAAEQSEPVMSELQHERIIELEDEVDRLTRELVKAEADIDAKLVTALAEAEADIEALKAVRRNALLQLARLAELEAEIAMTRADEREACAKLAQTAGFVDPPFQYELDVADRIAAAIRARGDVLRP